MEISTQCLSLFWAYVVPWAGCSISWHCWPFLTTAKWWGNILIKSILWMLFAFCKSFFIFKPFSVIKFVSVYCFQEYLNIINIFSYPLKKIIHPLFSYQSPIMLNHVGSYGEQLLFQPSSEYSKVPAAVRVGDIIGPDTTDTLECLAVITVI